ncbi:hypothetical protein ACOME3_000485 [Neoechinorhynchus agilis]
MLVVLHSAKGNFFRLSVIHVKEVAATDLFEVPQDGHTVRIKRSSSNFILLQCLVVAQLFKLKQLSKVELSAGGLVTALGVSMDTYDALTTKEARIDLIIRTLLKRAQSAMISRMLDVIESVAGPKLVTPVAKQVEDKDSSLSSVTRSILWKTPSRLSEVQGELSRTVYTDLLGNDNSANARARFRDRAVKILDDRKAHFVGLKKKPRDTVLNRALEDLRVAQNGIDGSLAIIDGVMEEIQATANLDDLPIMNVYRDDLDLESLVNCPVDLGTAFMAYMSRAKATVGQAEMTGSFTRDMESAIRNIKYNDAFVGPTTINEKSSDIDHKIRNDVRVRAHYLLNKIGVSKKRLMGLCYAHRSNLPLTSRNQNLCAAFCRELELLDGQGKLLEKAEWRVSRRLALLSFLRNRHFRRFCSSSWISADAVRTLVRNGVSSFVSSYISIVLAGSDGYAERLSEEWNGLMHAINGNPMSVPYIPTGYQMTVEHVHYTNTTLKMTTVLAGNYSLFRTLPLARVIILTSGLPVILHDYGLQRMENGDFLTEDMRTMAAAAKCAFFGDGETKDIQYYAGTTVNLADMHAPLWLAGGFSYCTSGVIGPGANDDWRQISISVRPGTDSRPESLHIFAGERPAAPVVIKTKTCWDRVFHFILSDDIGVNFRMDFTRVLNTVSHLSPMLGIRTLCGSVSLDHYRDGSPATFARLRALLSFDKNPEVTSPPPNGETNLMGTIRRMWSSQPFEVIWIRMSVVEYLNSIAVNNISWLEGDNMHNWAYDGRVLALVEQYFPIPHEQLFRLVATVWNPTLIDEIYMNDSGGSFNHFVLMDSFAKTPDKEFMVITVTLEEIAVQVRRFTYDHSNGMGGFPYDGMGLSILNGSPTNESFDQIPLQEELLSYMALSGNTLHHQVMGRLNVPYSSGVRLFWHYDPGFYFYPLVQLGMLRVEDLPAARDRCGPQDELIYYSPPNVLPRLRCFLHKLSVRLDTMQVSVKTATPEASWVLGTVSDTAFKNTRTIIGAISAFMGPPLAYAFAVWADDPAVTISNERTTLHWCLVSKHIGISIGSGITTYSESYGRVSLGVPYMQAAQTTNDELSTKFFFNNAVWSIVVTDSLKLFRVGPITPLTREMMPLITLKGFVAGVRSDITLPGVLLPRSCRGQFDVITIDSLFAMHIKLNPYVRLLFTLANNASCETRYDKGTFDVKREEKYADPFGIARCFEGDSPLAPIAPGRRVSTKRQIQKATSDLVDVSAEEQN